MTGLRGRELDESDVRVRPGRSGTRPRSKRRPEHADAVPAMVIAVDRGRWTCVVDDDAPRQVAAMRARELGRTPVVVGDYVDLVGDLSGRPGTLARIVRVAERSSALRRTADDTDPYERVVVANADQLVIVTSLADPPPRTGLIDRCLVAGYAGDLVPALCLTKADLAAPDELLERYDGMDLPVVISRIDEEPTTVLECLTNHMSVLIGHSGVGKSTLVNRIVPAADQAIGAVSAVGKGRHTTSAAVALPLRRDGSGGGWVIDTPGVRSFGLAHVEVEDVLEAFPDLLDVTADCPPGCEHLHDPDCALDRFVAEGGARPERLRSLRLLLASRAGG